MHLWAESYDASSPTFPDENELAEQIAPLKSKSHRRESGDRTKTYRDLALSTPAQRS
jgi:hypothetical protein